MMTVRGFCCFEALLLIVLATCSGSEAYHTFYVGGEDGWVQTPSEDYDHWAGRNRFQVNDTLVFKYKKGEDSVLHVKWQDYYSCNRSSPITNMSDGESVFKFDRSGRFFIISGADGHCEKGQRLVVIVMAVRSITYDNVSHRFYVGGGDGWVVSPTEEYNHWAGRNRFQVNDSLIFVHKEGVDSVLEVTMQDYYTCNMSAPIRKMTNGLSVFKLERSGPFYFISGAPGHCEKGQKLIVVVLAVRSESPVPSHALPPTPSLSPYAPLIAPGVSPSPSPSKPVTSPSPSPSFPMPQSPSTSAPSSSPSSFVPSMAPSPFSPEPSPSPSSFVPSMSPSSSSSAPSSSPSSSIPSMSPSPSGPSSYTSSSPSPSSSPISPSPSTPPPSTSQSPSPSGFLPLTPPPSPPQSGSQPSPSPPTPPGTSSSPPSPPSPPTTNGPPSLPTTPFAQSQSGSSMIKTSIGLGATLVLGLGLFLA